MDTDNQITVFAKTNFRNKDVAFGIKTDDRRRHMYLIGKTGMGKTTLMENMVIQDIRNGHGVAFLDPHGDSIQRILDCVPASRVNDVVYFNPADMEYPVAFNILESVDPKFKHLVASGLMGVFTKIWANLWSARMEYILNNTILALLDSPGNTLLGITRMYVDKKYRKKIVDNIKDPMVRAFWVDEFANYNEKYRTEAIAPIQNKVGQFLSSGIIRNIVGQPKSTIDLRDIMDNQKILIMDLSKGKVGEDNSALLGAMLVTKLQLAAMSRTDVSESERKDFYLYVDEFQNFATDSFATILSEARKYRLNLIVGHQYIAQLEEDKNTKVRDAIFGNVGTIVVFRIGAADAEFMETEFEPLFTPADLVNLPKYQIILKLMINGVASDPFSATTIPPSPEFVTNNGEKVIKVSRERYSNPAAEVEEKISRWMGAEFHQEAASQIESDSEKAEKEKTVIVENPELVQIEQPRKTELGPPVNQEAPVLRSNNEATPGESPGKDNFRPKSQAVPQNFVQNNQDANTGQNNALPKNRAAFRTPQHQQPTRPFKHDHNQDSRHRPQHQNPQRHQNQNQHSQPKKENPVWNTVADLNSQKQNQQKEQLDSAVQNIIQMEQPPNFIHPPMATPPAETEINPNVQTPVAVPSPFASKTVLKPGQTHKL